MGTDDKPEGTGGKRSDVPPKFKETSFSCPNCGVYAFQFWTELKQIDYQGNPKDTDATISKCHRCDSQMLWWKGSIVAPAITTAPFHHAETPEAVRNIYEEARGVFETSPRASAALLRLALETLCGELGHGGKSIDKAIGAMVADGLGIQVQRALDVVRVIGNNAVHPGKIDLNDDRETAIALFALINFVVERMIAEPKKIDELFEALPEGARDAIDRRDSSGGA